MTFSALDEPPERREARVLVHHGACRTCETAHGYPFPTCGSCGGHLPDDRVWRCPYVACRKWFRTRAEADAERAAHRVRRSEPKIPTAGVPELW